MSTDRSLEASSKVVDTLSKILTQAERAPEGSPERDLFMERAMRMSSMYSIDLAVARHHAHKKEIVEEPETRTFKVGVYGRPSQNAHFVDLMIAIADVYHCKAVISRSNVNVFLTGMPSDLDLIEKLYAHLSVQMVSEADAGIKAGANTEVRPMPKTRREEIPEDERAWGDHDGSDSYGESCYYNEKDDDLRDLGGVEHRYRYGQGWVKSYPPPRFRNVPVTDDDGNVVYEDKRVSTSDARIWRVNFYQGFRHRTAMRLREARAAALRDAGIDPGDSDNPKAVALRDKDKEVQEAYDEKYAFTNMGSYGGASVSSYSHTGSLAGDAAGQRASLGHLEKGVNN